MATVQAENIGDLVATTLRKLGRGKFTDLSIDLQRLVAFKMFSQKGMYKLTDDSGGYGFEWRLLMKTSNNNRLVGLYEPSNIQPMDGMVVAQAPFRNATGGYAFEHRELDMNKGESRIVDLIQERRLQDKIDFAQKFEGYFWNAPTGQATDLYSLPYWVVKNATTGFSGGLPSGYTTVANIVPDTYGSKWKNYTDAYTQVSVDDLILKTTTMLDKIDFEPPVDGIPTFNTGNKYGIYTNYPVYSGMKELLKAQNEDLGVDLDWADDKPAIRKSTVCWVPKLDADTTNPVYALNWGVFGMAILPGWWGKEIVEANTPGQPTVTTVSTHYTWNWLCRDRRRQGVISNGTTQP